MLLNKINTSQYLTAKKVFGHPIIFYSQKNNVNNYDKCYKILELSVNSDQELVRKAFIRLCKKYHPDSGQNTADALKFQEIESAYRSLQKKFSNERYNEDEEIGEYGLYYKEKKQDTSTKPEIFDIKHIAPQHRQYLSFDGIGSGTPFQREKQYIKHKAMVAIENIQEHQVNKLSNNDFHCENTLITKDKIKAKKIKTRYGIERLVEDLIQESMANGKFKNLKGEGKPLPVSNFNPYVDFVTHKMNEILIDNGFTPEWISLQREISEEIESIKESLLRERKKLGPLPLNELETNKWEKIVEGLNNNVRKLNQKINKFNLVVPILNKQKLYFNLGKTSCDILMTGACSEKHMTKDNKAKNSIKLNSFDNLFPFF